VAGVLFIAGATAVLVGEEWPTNLVPPTEAAESTAPSGTLIPPRPNFAALAADFEVAPLSADDVRQLQTKLDQLGFAPGKIDGIAGARTLGALNAYRGSRNLAPVKTVDYSTAAGLLD
jgi:peptidoglycan hydrolase-like protein with peptidoglycan-binding domain